MSIRANQYAKPSTLPAVLRAVRDLFADSGDTTMFLIGKGHLSNGIGAAPRVVFVPDVKGKLAPATESGYTWSITHGCDMYVRGAESGDDFGRYDAAHDLADKVLSAIRRAGAGRLDGGDFSDDSPLDVDAIGADVALSFTYTRNVRHDDAIMRVAPAPLDTTPPRPQVPPGIPASAITIDVTTDPKDT